MNINTIKIKAEKLNKEIKKASVISSLCICSAVSLFVPAFMTKGRLVDYVSFCFQPSEVHDPYIYKEVIKKSFALDSKGKYIIGKNKKKKIITRKTKEIIGKRFCNEKTIRKGVSYVIAQEIDDSLEFKSKVKILKKYKAQNPNAGWFGISSGLILLIGGVVYGLATQEMEDNLDSLIHVKRSQMIKDALDVEHDLIRTEQDVKVETEYIKQGIAEYHKEKYIGLDPEPSEEEINKRREEAMKHELLRDTSIELELASMKADLAEKRKKEAEHLKELNKLTQPIKDKIKHRSQSKDESNQYSKEELIQKLKDHENGWLYTLVKSRKPLFLNGSQGSWKSFFSASVALCRLYTQEHSIVSLVDPHFNKNKKRAWKELIEFEPIIYGDLINVNQESESKWIEVNQGLIDSMRRWETEDETSKLKTSIFDEVTNYAKHDECKSSSEKFMGTLLSDPRKANEAPIVITHSMTNKGTGGGDGFKDAREEGCFVLKLSSDNDQQPTYKGTLEGFKDNDGNLIDSIKITIPKEWFNPKSIKEMFK